MPPLSPFKILTPFALLVSLLVLHSYCKVQQVSFDLPRGAHPELAAFYSDSSSSDTFQCLDGTKTVPFNQINDDFCDCEDGSDEPGTAACSRGQFYCANRGHVAKILASSRVNDGICDCCDGSDEWQGEGQGEGEAEGGGLSCSNKCEELGQEARVRAEKEAAAHQEGFLAKQSLIREGKELKAKRQGEVEKLQKELELAQELQLDKEEVKLVAEEAENAALEKHRAEKDREREAREEEERKEDVRKAEEVFDALDTNQDGKVGRSEIMAAVDTFDQNKDGVVSEEEATFFLGDREEFQKEDFRTSGWMLVKHQMAEAKNEGQKAEEVPEVPVEKAPPKSPDYHEDAGMDGEEEEEEEEEEEIVTAPPATAATTSSFVPTYDEATGALVDAAEKARTEFEAVRKEAQELEKKIEGLKKSLEKDYGPEDEYAALAFAGKCAEMTDLEYTYKVCLFEYASQIPKSGGSDTKLGNWERWSSTPPSVPDTMIFSGGQQCWNGPARSTKVHVKCAAEIRLVSVSEPSKCEYEMVLEIPSACRNPKLDPIKHDEL